MCYLFAARLVPDSTPTCVVLKPKGPFFLNGFSKKYSSRYESSLGELISQQEFIGIIDDLNEKIESHWPCLCSMIFGYIMAIFTFGLSLLIPWICINEAEGQATRFIEHINKDVLIYRLLRLRLVKKWCVSWIEVRKLITNPLDECDKSSLMEMTHQEDLS